MISNRDGHVRVLPLHVANKIAAGEVVERPASVVKELVENAIDAGASKIEIAVTQGGRKLIAVQDDGCGMTKDDALLSLERQATSKIRDVSDIEEIDTLGFRGEALPSIASVSRFSLTTRRTDSDEGTAIQVNAGTIADIRPAGCPTGTRIEVRDLFCNTPARRKFLRSYATEESHIRQVFTVHALAHPAIGFSLTADGRELYRLAPAADLVDRLRDLFGPEFLERVAPVGTAADAPVRVSGVIERPNLSVPTRREQYVFVNGRPASAPSIGAALREACPRRAGDIRPAAVLFLELSPKQVDVNVHPTKREVRFRDNAAVKSAIVAAIESALAAPARAADAAPAPQREPSSPVADSAAANPPDRQCAFQSDPSPTSDVPRPAPVPMEFALEPDSARAKPWRWFKYLAQSASGYLLIETDAGIVTINPHAARERIAYERLLRHQGESAVSQALLIPETVRLSPVDFSRIRASLDVIGKMGFQVEEFGQDTFKIDALPQGLSGISPLVLLSTISKDLSESGSRHGGLRWKEELIAKSIARTFAGSEINLDEARATQLVEELCSCQMPYVCPRGKPVMIFTSNRELDRKFDRI